MLLQPQDSSLTDSVPATVCIVYNERVIMLFTLTLDVGHPRGCVLALLLQFLLLSCQAAAKDYE